MLLLSAPLSREVSLPLTSTTETCPACRMVAEKFTGIASYCGDIPILPAAAGQTKRIVSYNTRKAVRAPTKLLLPHDYPHTAPPALRKTDAHNLHFRGEVAQQFVSSRMKTQRRCHQVNQRGSCLQLYAGKIPVARQIAPLEVVAHMPPVSRGLKSQVNVLGRFQFQNCQAPA